MYQPGFAVYITLEPTGDNEMREFFRKLELASDTLLKHVVETFTSEKGYSAFFKAGVILVGAAMIALSQTGTFLYDKDLSAHKAVFMFESATGKSLDVIDCKTLSNPLKGECLVAKHEIKTLTSSLNLLSSIVYISLWFGIACLVGALIGFILAPFQRVHSNL
jgi:hypothetical protein